MKFAHAWVASLPISQLSPPLPSSGPAVSLEQGLRVTGGKWAGWLPVRLCLICSSGIFPQSWSIQLCHNQDGPPTFQRERPCKHIGARVQSLGSDGGGKGKGGEGGWGRGRGTMCEDKTLCWNPPLKEKIKRPLHLNLAAIIMHNDPQLSQGLTVDEKSASPRYKMCINSNYFLRVGRNADILLGQ